MTRQPEESRLLRILAAGFTLLILLLAASVYIGIGTMRSTESGTAQLMQGQQAALRLIEDVQREEDSLGAVFYELAAGNGPVSRPELLQRLDKLEKVIQNTIAAGLASGDPRLWAEVKVAVASFIAEGRLALTSGKPPPPKFYRAHEALINTLGELATFHFDVAAEAQTREMDDARDRVRFSMLLLGSAMAIALIGTLLTVRVVSRMFHQLSWQALELAHLSSRTMADQEETARRFSRELHDEFGQTLSAIEANLVAIHNARELHMTRIEDCLALVKQAIENARELSQLLRPSILDDFGLDASLRWLADGFSQRTGIAVDYRSSGVERLSDATETQVFRIFQEALTNVGRHSGATGVRVDLTASDTLLTLLVADNGRGILGTAHSGGLGLVGMRARARAADGKLTVESAPDHGVTIRVELPLSNRDHASQITHSAR